MKPTPVITWFEIPAVDFERAVRFYENVFGKELKREQMDEMPMAIFPHTDEHTGGAVVHCPAYKPSTDGICIYLYTTDFDATLQRVEQHGGKVTMPKMEICAGYIAQFIDSEGNRIGLHANP